MMFVDTKHQFYEEIYSNIEKKKIFDLISSIFNAQPVYLFNGHYRDIFGKSTR